MNKENEYIAGKNAAVDDIRHNKKRDVSIYPSEYYQNGYTEVMGDYEKRKINSKKGGK